MASADTSETFLQIRVGEALVRITSDIVALHEVAHALMWHELGYELESVSVGIGVDEDGNRVAGLALLTPEAHQDLDRNPDDSVRSSLAGPAAEFQEMARTRGVDFESYFRAQADQGWFGDIGQAVIALRPEIAGTHLDRETVLDLIRPRLRAELARHKGRRMILLKRLQGELSRIRKVNDAEFARLVRYYKGLR